MSLRNEVAVLVDLKKRVTVEYDQSIQEKTLNHDVIGLIGGK